MSKAIITIEDGDGEVQINVVFTPAVEGYEKKVKYISHKLAITLLNHAMELLEMEEK